MTSLNSTILGCFNCLRTDISLKVVLGIPSSSTSRRIRYLYFKLIINIQYNIYIYTFRATNSSVCLSLALYTTPYVPYNYYNYYNH